MNHYPLVTIAIPVYNCEKTIQKTIRSVLNQSFHDFEVLVYDDGSTDCTVSLIKGFSDSRIKLFKDGCNKGIAYRLNQLIDLASGYFFVRMDGDDLMFPDRLEKQIRFLQENPEVDVVGSPAIVIDENDHIIGQRGDNISCVWQIDDLFMSSRFIHPTVVGKTEWFKRWKYNENLSGCEDMDLWIRSFKDSKFLDYNEPLLFYREYLKIRLKTYFRRQRLLLNYSWKNRKMTNKRYTFLLLTAKIAISSVAACVLHLIGCEKNVILRRNNSLSKEELLRFCEIIDQY